MSTQPHCARDLDICGNCQGTDPAHQYRGGLVLCWLCADKATCPECGRITPALLDGTAEICAVCEYADLGTVVR